MGMRIHTDKCYIFTAGTVENTSALLQNIKYSKTSVQIKTADNLQSQCDVNSNLHDHFQLNARLPSPFNSLQNLPPWLWSVCRYLASCNSAQSYIYISGKLDIAMQNICGVPVKGNIVF